MRQYLPARYRALADLGAGLGLRQGEAFGLAVDDDRMRQAVDTDFAQWETEMSDGPATAQGVRR